VKNPDLWRRLDALLGVHSVNFIWVRGHADNEYNNRCDELAVAESRNA
jgi:ribonuclease HI